MFSRRQPSSATAPLTRVAWAGLLAAGCNALTLDGLQAGSGGAGSTTGTGGEAPSATSSTTTASTSSASAGGSTSTSTATGAGGDGGAPGTGGGGGGGGATGPGGAGGAGGACPDVCAQVDATFCDAFDIDPELDAWFQSVFDTTGPTFTIVDDPHVSCPHAARVDFAGADDGADGGWAQIGRTIPGSPTTARVDLRILRQPSATALEGMFEIAWDRGEAGCFFQVYAAEQPRTVAFYADQYGAVDAPLGEDSANLIESTVDRWMDVSVTIEVGANPKGSVTVDGVTIEAELDVAGAATCDEGIDPSTLEVRLGAPYNQLATVLLYDDVVVTTE